MDGFEIAVEGGEDGYEFIVFGASNELGSKREKEGNLEGNLILVSAIKDTVEFGIGKRDIDFFGECGFCFSGFFLG